MSQESWPDPVSVRERRVGAGPGPVPHVPGDLQQAQDPRADRQPGDQQRQQLRQCGGRRHWTVQQRQEETEDPQAAGHGHDQHQQEEVL